MINSIEVINLSKKYKSKNAVSNINFKIGENAMLFFRQNFYKYYDPNFEFNNLKGTETMLELKFLF